MVILQKLGIQITNENYRKKIEMINIKKRYHVAI